jgi:hypothetical protein
MGKMITTKKLGELLQHWHGSASDPIYGVGSLLFAGKPVDEEQVKKARDRIRALLRSAEQGSHGWGQQEVEELKTISDGLGGLLRVYSFGEMPTIDDFRKHLAHDRDDKGHRYISSSKPILGFELKGRAGQQALKATNKADDNKAAAGKGRADITATQKGDTVSINVNNIESLFYWIMAMTESGPESSNLAKAIMQDLGYSWVGARSNPSLSRSWKKAELEEMRSLLKSSGYDPRHAEALYKEGMGSYELEHRLRSAPSGVGSLEYTHGYARGSRKPNPSQRPADFTGKFYLARVPLDRGGYTPRGRYFGVGAPLFEYYSDGYEFHDEIRARDRKAAKAKILAVFPRARFYR